MNCPYPGLRPFDVEESHLFFGRDRQTNQLLKKLARTHFLAVVGPSGCGKSSLVRAGMIAGLETGFMVQAGTRWAVATMRPGSHPISRLAAVLADDALTDGEGPPVPAPFIEAGLRRGPRGLLEVLGRRPLPRRTNLLILVDQFEEIFRFRTAGGGDEAEAFVALLLETARAATDADPGEIPVYIVMTMRSDFLGDCALFTGLPEAINESQFLTPRLTREEREQAIVGPARVYDGDVAPALVNALLNDMGADPDQLPLMQHLLMRMWTRSRGDQSLPVVPAFGAAGRTSRVTGFVLAPRDYGKIGGFGDALSRHAREAFDSLDAEHQRIAEVLFRRLCEPGVRAVRRPAPIDEVATVAGVDPAEVIKVVDAFRREDRSFLGPAPPETLYANTIVDISHEALIRQWDTMRGWVEAEGKSVETYQLLEQTARLWKDGRAALWGTPNLELAVAWRDKEQPTAVWARRYGGNFDLAMEFLDASVAAREERELAARLARRRHRQNLVKWTIGAAAAAVLFAVLAGLAYLGQRQADRSRTAARAMLEMHDRLTIDPELSAWLAFYAYDRDPSLAQRAPYEALWNSDRLRAVYTLPPTPIVPSDDPVTAVAFDGAGGRLAMGRGNTLVWWRVGADPALGDSAVVAHVDSLNGPINSLAFSPDGSLLAGATSEGVRLWTGAGRPAVSLRDGQPADSATPSAVAFDVTGQRLATGDVNGDIRMWRVTGTGATLEGSLRGHTGRVYALAFDPSTGRLLSSSADSTARVWIERGPTWTGAILADTSIGGNGNRTDVDFVRGVAVGAGGIVATGSDRGSVKLWQSPGRCVAPRCAIRIPSTTPLSLPGRITGLAFAGGGRELVAISDRGSARVWRVTRLGSWGALVSVPTALDGHLGALSSIALDSSTVVTGSVDGTAKVWNLSARPSATTRTLRDHGDRVRGVAYGVMNERMLLATAGDDRRVVVWDVSDEDADTTVSQIELPGRAVSVGFSPDGALLGVATLEGNEARVWALRDVLAGDHAVRETLRHDNWVWDIEFSPRFAQDSLVATGGADRVARLWKSGVEIGTLAGHEGWVMDVTFGPNDRLGTASRDGTVRLWDVSDPAAPKLRHTLAGHTAAVRAVAFSPVSRQVATASDDQTVRLWDGDTGDPVGTLLGHDGEVWSVAYSPDGRMLATASYDGTVRFWDAETGDGLVKLPVSDEALGRIAFSPDGRWLAVTGWDQLVRLVDVNVNSVIAKGWRRVTRRVVEAECKRFLNENTCPDFFTAPHPEAGFERVRAAPLLRSR